MWAESYDYQGECWGTAEFNVGDGGWTAAWSGKFDLYNYVARVSLTARGTGTFAGKELKLEAMGPDGCLAVAAKPRRRTPALAIPAGEGNPRHGVGFRKPRA